MRLLDLPEQDVLKEWQRQRGTGSNQNLDIYFADLTLLRQTLDVSLAEVPPELQWKIAEKLLAADGATVPAPGICNEDKLNS